MIYVDIAVTPTNIMFVLGLLGTLFTVYNYFRNPQIKSEKDDLVLGQSIIELTKKITSLDTAFQSHITADQTAFGMLNQHVVEVDKSVVRLTTIIDERIPKPS